eukprot:45026_1
MGGIDAILSHYLSTTASLTTQQLQQIHAIMSSKNEIQHYTPKETIDLEDTSSNELVLSFDVNDTYLHLLFGSHYGSMIINRFVYNKRFLYPMFVLVNVGFLQFFREYISDLFITIPAFVMWSVVAPWLLLLLLSMNIKAFKMISTSFDFWMKIIYMIIYASTRFIYVHYITIYVEESRKSMTWFIYDIIYSCMRILVILVWSSLDALQLPLYVKIYLGLLISIIYSLNTLVVALHIESETDDSIIHITDSLSISLMSFIDSSIKIVCMFLWKQTILSILRKNRCILIKHSPFIQWTHEQDCTEKQNQHKSHNSCNHNGENVDLQLTKRREESAASEVP